MKAVIRYTVAALVVAIVGLGHGQAAVDQVKAGQIHAFADSVLQMKDTQQYSQMYSATFHPKMRKLSESEWVDKATKTAAKTGALKTRSFKDVQEISGGYKVIYAASYATIGDAIEIVNVVSDGTTLKVIGLFTIPKNPPSQ